MTVYGEYFSELGEGHWVWWGWIITSQQTKTAYGHAIEAPFRTFTTFQALSGIWRLCGIRRPALKLKGVSVGSLKEGSVWAVKEKGVSRMINTLETKFSSIFLSYIFLLIDQANRKM